MANLQRDLSEFIGLLNSTGVEFVVVGGHAVAFHGHPRLTGDIDILLRPTPDNAARVLRALNDFGFGNLDLRPADFTTQEKIVQLGRPPNRIDLLTSISAVPFDEAWTHASFRQARRSSGKFSGLGCADSEQNRFESRQGQARCEEVAGYCGQEKGLLAIGNGLNWETRREV
jgi:hypothetical protein